MRIIWIGFVVPEDLSAKLAALDRYITSQTQVFQSRVIRSLEHDSQHQVTIVASPPATDYSAVRVTGLRRWKHREQAGNDLVVPMINVIGLKQLTVFAGCFLGAIARGLRASSEPTVVVVGDCYFPHLLAAAATSLLLRVPATGFITDMPGLLAVADPWYKRWLRPLDAAVVRGLLRRMNGLVVLSEHIARDFFPTTRYLVMPGIAEKSRDRRSDQRNGDETNPELIIMYSGALMAEYGVGLLVEAFGKLALPSARLWITGRGDFEPAVVAAAKHDPRITFFGFLSTTELQEKIARATLLVSLRLSHQGHARYSFPSKLLEYMTTDSFVVTNRFPSLPADYENHLIVLENESSTALADIFRGVAAGRFGAQRDFAQRMQGFIAARASLPAEGRRLATFLSGSNVASPPRAI